MKAEQSLHQKENPDEYANGYRYCKAIAQSKKMVLKVPRTRKWHVLSLSPCSYPQ